MSDERLAEMTKLIDDYRDAVADATERDDAESTNVQINARIRLDIAIAELSARRSSSETAQLGEALVAALTDLKGSHRSLALDPQAVGDEVTIIDPFTDNFALTDNMRHLAALLASSQREAKT